jgi:hypothetical protein
MATVAVNFTHFDLTCKKGDTLPDDHPLVALAPHLFEQPKSKKQPGGQPPKPKEA